MFRKTVSLSLAAALLALATMVLILSSRLAEARNGAELQSHALAELRQANGGLSSKLSNYADELASAVKERTELMRLRNELSLLKASITPLPSGTIAHPEVDTNTRQDGAPAESVEDAQAISRHTLNSCKLLGVLARIYSTYSDGELPTNMVQLQGSLPLTLPGNTKLDRFELVDHGRPLTTSDPNAMLLRERDARLQPNGGWAKVYGLADGTTVEKTSMSGDFSKIEHDFILTGSAQSEEPASSSKSVRP